MKPTALLCLLFIPMLSTWASRGDRGGDYKAYILEEVRLFCRKDLDLTLKTEDRINYLIIDRFKKRTKLMLMERDDVARPYVVNFQKALEEFLIEQSQNRRLKSLTCIIHTPRPSTPLCNPPGKIIRESVNESVINNPEILLTVTKRGKTLRELIQYADTYIVYPKGGLDRRSKFEQAAYQEALENPKNTKLRNIELSEEEMPPGMSGATYIFENIHGKKFVFAMAGSQVVDADTTIWNMWLGPIDDEIISKRIAEVKEFLRIGGFKLNI